MVYVFRAGIDEGYKEEAIKAVSTGFGAIGGFGISEFTGEFITKYAGLTGNKKLIGKAIVRILIAIGLFGASLMAGGMLTWILYAASAGSVGGVFYDIVSYLYPGGFTGLAERAVIRAKSTSVIADRVVKEFTVETTHSHSAPSSVSSVSVSTDERLGELAQYA